MTYLSAMMNLMRRRKKKKNRFSEKISTKQKNVLYLKNGIRFYSIN